MTDGGTRLTNRSVSRWPEALPPFGPIRWLLIQPPGEGVPMHLPGPRFQRMATLVVIDGRQRVALLPRPDSAARPFTFPRSPVGLAESYAQAAVRLATHSFTSLTLQWGSVAGRRWAALPDGVARARREEHVFLTRIKPSLTSSSVKRGRPAPAIVWTPRAHLQHLLQEPHFDSTATLIDGYLDGWLPDGPVTLD